MPAKKIACGTTTRCYSHSMVQRRHATLCRQIAGRNVCPPYVAPASLGAACKLSAGSHSDRFWLATGEHAAVGWPRVHDRRLLERWRFLEEWRDLERRRQQLLDPAARLFGALCSKTITTSFRPLAAASSLCRSLIAKPISQVDQSTCAAAAAAAACAASLTQGSSSATACRLL